MVAGIGCLGPEPDADAVSAALTASASADFWPNGIVPVCFSPRDEAAAGSQRFVEMMGEIQNAVEGAYETIPDVGIDFQGWEICEDADEYLAGGLPGTVRIIVSPANYNGNWIMRNCPPDIPFAAVANPPGSCDPFPSTRSYESVVWATNANNLVTYALHEMAHVLRGAGHEHDRSDNVGPNAPDPNCQGDGAISSARFLTTYDPLSILKATYCGLWPGDLSAKDKLGFEMMYYDGDFTQPVRGRFDLALNNALVLRSDDSVVPSWTRRGAADQAFPNLILWNIPGTSNPSGYALSYSASYLSAGVVHQMSGTFDDFRGREHYTSGSVLVSDGLHTALVMAAMQ